MPDDISAFYLVARRSSLRSATSRQLSIRSNRSRSRFTRCAFYSLASLSLCRSCSPSSCGAREIDRFVRDFGTSIISDALDASSARGRSPQGCIVTSTKRGAVRLEIRVASSTRLDSQDSETRNLARQHPRRRRSIVAPAPLLLARSLLLLHTKKRPSAPRDWRNFAISVDARPGLLQEE